MPERCNGRVSHETVVCGCRSRSCDLGAARIRPVSEIAGNENRRGKKFGSVLSETVINAPYNFRILHNGRHNGAMSPHGQGKGVANFYRYTEIGRAANANYLNALAVESDPRLALESLQSLTAPVTRSGHRYGGFNPVKTADVKIFKTVMNGDFVTFCFQRDIRKALFEPAKSPKNAARLSVRTGRLLKKSQVHGLSAKVPRSLRWRVTENERDIMSTVIEIYDVK